MSGWIVKAKGFVTRQEPIVLTVALLLCISLWGLAALTDEVLEGDTQRFDEAIMHALRKPGPDGRLLPVGPAWLKASMLDITALGGVTVVALLVAVVAGFLLLIRRYHLMWLVLGASIGASLVNTLVKFLIARPRPDLTLRLSEVSSLSFPSGHSTISAAVYLTLGGLLAQTVSGRWAKAYFLSVALGLTFLVGVSRVYLGVHYPSDVLAGWTSGLIWAILIWLLGRYLQRRGAIEQENEPAAPPGTALDLDQ